MGKKRSVEQLDFDMMKRGWAFCNVQMLAGKIEALESLSKHLAPNDGRHEELARIKKTKEEMSR